MDQNDKQREWRQRTGNASTKKYEKTKNGFLMRCYRNMKSRVSGVQKKKSHLYVGKQLLDKEEFYAWSKQNHHFHALFMEWERSGYNRKLTPTVDRIDPAIGYKIGNMEWVTHSENSRRGGLWRKPSSL